MIDQGCREYSPEKPTQVLAFTTGGMECGVDILLVQEIHEIVDVAPVANAPSYVDGVVTLFDRSIPVIDLRMRLGIGARQRSKATRIVIVEVRSTFVGFIADAVTEVLCIPAHGIRAEEPCGAGIDGVYVKGHAGVGDRRITILNLEKVLLPDGEAPAWLGA